MLQEIDEMGAAARSDVKTNCLFINFQKQKKQKNQRHQQSQHAKKKREQDKNYPLSHRKWRPSKSPLIHKQEQHCQAVVPPPANHRPKRSALSLVEEEKVEEKVVVVGRGHLAWR